MKKAITLMMVVALLLGSFVSCAKEESVAEYPTKSIQLIAPYNPGGDTDFNARAYAKFLEAELGQPVVVVNVSGSGGVTGSRRVKDASPDGYTALFMHPALMVNYVAGTAEYGIDGFEHVASVGRSPGEIVTVNANSGFKTFSDLVEYSKANPGELTVAADLGTMTHIMSLMMLDSGADFNVVSAGGASERVAQLLGGHIDVIINSYGTVKDYLETGDFVALGMTNEERSGAFPDILPLKEQGYDVVFEKHYFVLMPKETPQEIVATFSDALKRVSENEEYRAMIYESYGQEPFFEDNTTAVSYIEGTAKMLDGYRDRFVAK